MAAEPNRDRWYQIKGKPDFSICTQSIASALLVNDLMRVEPLLGRTEEGLLDIRGFPFAAIPQEEEDKRVKLRKYNLPIYVEPTIFEAIRFEGYDFSEALVSNTTWVACEFINCIFCNQKIQDVKFEGCKFIKTSFINCQNGAVFGEIDQNRRCEFIECMFIRGKLDIMLLHYPIFSKCLFKQNIYGVDFEGSQFSDCRFEGRLNLVTFRGRVKPKEWDVFKDISEVPENKMINIDFTKSKLDCVYFIDGIDLTNCYFPDQKGLVIVRDAKNVIKQAIEIITNEWEGENKRLASSALEPILVKLEQEDQPVEVINIPFLHKNQNELERKKLEYPEDEIEYLLRSVMSKN